MLGAYEPILDSIDVLAVPRWLFLHLAAFDLYVAVIPFAASALVVASGLRRDAERPVRLLSALTLATAVPLFAAVAVYSSNPGPPQLGYASGAGANERATFVLAPLAFVGLVVWLRNRRSSHRAVVAAAAVAAVIPAAIPLDRYTENEVITQGLSLVPWVGTRDHTAWPVGVLVLTLSLAALFVLLVRSGARDVAFVAPVATVLVAVIVIAQPVMEDSAEWARSAGIGESRNWVDRAAGDAEVSVLWYEPGGSAVAPHAGRHRVVWLNEFYNRSVGRVYELGSPMPYSADLPSTRVRLADGRVVLEDGTPASLGPLVLAPCFVRVDGTPLARDSATGAIVYRVPRALRVTVSDPGGC